MEIRGAPDQDLESGESAYYKALAEFRDDFVNVDSYDDAFERGWNAALASLEDAK